MQTEIRRQTKATPKAKLILGVMLAILPNVAIPLTGHARSQGIELELLNGNISLNKKIKKYVGDLRKKLENNWSCSSSTQSEVAVFFKIDPFGRIKDITPLDKNAETLVNRAATRAIEISGPLENPPIRVSLKLRATFDCSQLKTSEPLPEPPSGPSDSTQEQSRTRESVTVPQLIDVSGVEKKP